MERPTSLEQFSVYRLLRSLYDGHVRDRLPQKVGVYNGIPVRDRALFDLTDEQPEYEKPLIRAIERTVQTGDLVVIIGGGRGVSTVMSARKVGPSGNVSTYEGSEKQYELTLNTVDLNCVDDRVSMHFEVVGDAVSVWGEGEQAPITDPEELPSSDVLVLDCEGAERDIMSELSEYPPAVIVETHGYLGVSPDEMEQKLESHGYTITNREMEIEEKGIVILTAEL